MAYTDKICYDDIPLGLSLRKQLNKEFIYRIQPGNGFHGSKIGKLYQHKYTYFVPSSINNPESNHSRSIFAAAVAAWQSLTELQKNVWRELADLSSNIPGYNYFIRDYFDKNY